MSEFRELREAPRAATLFSPTELIAPISGPARTPLQPAASIRVRTQIQDTRGEHQYAVIAAREIEHAAGSASR